MSDSPALYGPTATNFDMGGVRSMIADDRLSNNCSLRWRAGGRASRTMAVDVEAWEEGLSQII